MTCPACGRKPAHIVKQYRYRESGLDNVFVNGVGLYRCKCGQEYVQLPGVQAVHDQVAAVLLKKESLLTGPESKFLRKWLRLTSEAMAQALGYTRVTVSRWENEGPSAKTDRALRLYASAMRNITIDFQDLFPSINDKPQRNFRIVVDGVRTAPQITSGMAQTASALGEIRAAVFQYSVDVSTATAIISPTSSSAQETLYNFEIDVNVPAEAMQAANQELAQAA